MNNQMIPIQNTDGIIQQLYGSFGIPQNVYNQVVSRGTDSLEEKIQHAAKQMDWISYYALTRYSVQRGLNKHDLCVLLFYFGSCAIESQRAWARLQLAELIHAELHDASLGFIFSHAIVVWGGQTPKESLNDWADRLGLSYKTLLCHRDQAAVMLEGWLNHATNQAYNFIYLTK